MYLLGLSLLLVQERKDAIDKFAIASAIGKKD